MVCFRRKGSHTQDFLDFVREAVLIVTAFPRTMIFSMLRRKLEKRLYP